MSVRILRYVVAAIAVCVGTVASAREGDTPVRYDDHALVRVRLMSDAISIYIFRCVPSPTDDTISSLSAHLLIFTSPIPAPKPSLLTQSLAVE